MQATTADQYGSLSQFMPMTEPRSQAFAASSLKTLASPYCVLIIEASVPLGRLLANGLLAERLSVEVTHDLYSGREKFENLPTELLILDMDLSGMYRPDMDGPALLRSLRMQRPGVRILALSARTGIEDMVLALDNGADDYLQKPFSLLELMARVRALRRRSQVDIQRTAPRASSLVLHREQCQVERDGRLIELTPREFTLLEYLMQNAGKTLSRAILTQKVWNMTADGTTNIVDVYIKYLRDKLDGDHDVKLIRTVRGMGYSYQAQA